MILSLLIIVPTCFDHSSRPSSGSSQVYRRMQLMCQLKWERFYTSVSKYNLNSNIKILQISLWLML